jgi:hypothetical protein
MDMPGFAAEASLYQSRECYAATIRGPHAGGAIHAAAVGLLKWPPPSAAYQETARPYLTWPPPPCVAVRCITVPMGDGSYREICTCWP